MSVGIGLDHRENSGSETDLLPDEFGVVTNGGKIDFCPTSNLLRDGHGRERDLRASARFVSHVEASSRTLSRTMRRRLRSGEARRENFLWRASYSARPSVVPRRWVNIEPRSRRDWHAYRASGFRRRAQAIRDKIGGAEGNQLKGPLVEVHVCMETALARRSKFFLVGWHLFNGRAAGVKKTKRVIVRTRTPSDSTSPATSSEVTRSGQSAWRRKSAL
jgi:hypothetical protein